MRGTKTLCAYSYLAHGPAFVILVVEIVLTVTEENNVHFPTVYKSCVTAHAINSHVSPQRPGFTPHCSPYGRVVLDSFVSEHQVSFMLHVHLSSWG